MNIREVSILVFCGSIVLFFIVLAVQLSQKQKRKVNIEALVNGTIALDQSSTQTVNQLGQFSFMQKRYKSLQLKLDQLYDDSQTPESITKYQLLSLLFGLGITVLIQLIFRFMVFTVFGLVVTLLLFFLKDMDLANRIHNKHEEFDRCLPQYETNLLLGLQAGAGLQKAMEMAVRTLPAGLVQIEFRQLLLETNMYADNIALPYIHLAQRVPTKDNERFCNIVISGIKNGNEMSEILTQESEYMTQQQLNRIKAKGESNSVISTLITSAMVFLPLIIIFLAPMMASSM